MHGTTALVAALCGAETATFSYQLLNHGVF